MYGFLVYKDQFNELTSFDQLTQRQMKYFLTDFALQTPKCSLAHRRFMLIGTWLTIFKKVKIPGSATSYFNKLIKLSRRNPPLVFKYGLLGIDNATFYITRLNKKDLIPVNTSSGKNFTETCFKSILLIVGCKFEWLGASKGFKLSALNVTFMLAKTKKLKVAYSYHFDTNNPSFTSK